MTPSHLIVLLIIGLLDIRSFRKKVEYIIVEFQLVLLCITETWLFESDAGIIEAALPKTLALFHVPRAFMGEWERGRSCCNILSGFVQHQSITS